MCTKSGARTVFLLFVTLLCLGQASATNTLQTSPGFQIFLPTTFKPQIPIAVPTIRTTIQLPTGSHPHGIALDPANQRAFVGNHESDTLSILDTADMSLIQTIPLYGASGPNGVAYYAPTDRVYIANRDSANVSVVNPTSQNWLHNIPVGQMPDGLTIQDNLLYVANFGSDTVSLIEPVMNTVIKTLPVGSQPAMLDAGDAGAVYLSAYGENTINYLNPTGVFNNHPNVTDPYGLSFDPITFRLYVVNRGLGGGLTMIDVSPNLAAGAIDTGPEEAFVTAVNPRTGHIFVVCDDVAKIYDRRDNALITTLAMNGGSEEGIAIDPERNLVYVTNSDTDTVTVIQDTLTFDLVYTGWRNTGILVNVEDTGQHERQLTEPQLHYGHPEYSPDGRHLTVSIYDYLTGETDIYRLESGGQNKINLTPTPLSTEDVQATWSPDGSQIAWRRDWRIWLMDADGSNKTPLSPPELTARDPVWSPDGQWMSFVSWDGDHEDVFIIPSIGGTAINVTNHVEVDLGQSWSADSTHIAFESFRDNNWEIYTADITDPQNIILNRLTNNLSNDHGAAWSHDGQTISFVSDRDEAQYEYAVWLMNANGTNQHQLTAAMDIKRPLVWSPDDLWLASSAGYGFESQLYKYDVLSGIAYQLSQTGFTVDNPAWRSDTWE